MKVGNKKMGIDTCAKLLGHIYPEQILDFITKNFDSNAKMKNYNENHMGDKFQYDFIEEGYGDLEKWIDYTCCINFEYKNEYRQIFYFYQNINSYENIEYYTPLGLESMVKSETTYINLSNCGDSVEIIKSITSYFGGWIDENDCDDEPYYYIPPNQELNKYQPKIIHLTKQQICDKYDVDYVIIDD